MRKTIIFGALAALLGLATAVQASDHSRYTDGTQVAREADHDRDNDRNDRYERTERSRDRHDQARERDERHDESQERRDRR